MLTERGHESEGTRRGPLDPEALWSNPNSESERGADAELTLQIEEFTRTFSDRWEW